MNGGSLSHGTMRKIPTPRIKAGLALAALLAVTTAHAQPPTTKLPSYGADIQKTSVSGLSSGAFMTSQLYVAFSNIMVGAGIVAGGPYLCAKSWSDNTLMENATTTCMDPLTPSVGPNTPSLVQQTSSLASSGKIDTLDNLKNDRIYIFSGQNDDTVTTTVVDQTYKFFTSVGVPESSIKYDKSVDAGHALITNSNTDTSCSLTKAPYINDCNFEQSAVILNQIYSDLKPAADQLSSPIIAFDQSEFIDSDNTSMSDTAYAYVPAACQNGKSCPIHVVFHGCKQGAAVIGDKYYAQTGYNQMAEANDFIMLYPQVQPSNASPLNPEGCWDFWGYSSPGDPNPDYFTSNAPQLRAVHKMISRLAGPRSASASLTKE